jgi:AcrR family transcriptional regulator
MTPVEGMEVDTKQRLLDAAERLFAQQGFHATSLRAITGEAGANLAAVNYHFGSKEGLMEAVIDRRLTPLNKQRTAALDAALVTAAAEGRRPEAREVLRAFIEPTLRFRQAESRDFIALVGRMVSETDDTLRRIFVGRMEPFRNRVFEALKLALPDVSEAILNWRLHFTIGAMAHTMFMVNKHPFPGAAPTEPDTEGLLGLLLPYVTAGMEAPGAGR